MSTPTSPDRKSTWVGVLVGAVLLGLVALFAIGLPKSAGADTSTGSNGSNGSTAPLALPDTLPGGYTASDLPEAFTGAAAKQADQIAAQQQQNRKYGDEVLDKALSAEAVTRTYATKDLSAVFVQAFRAEGGAFSPDSLADPRLTGQEHASQELVPVGDAACIEQWPQQQAGGQGDTPAYSQCQLSDDGLTVQVSGGSTSPDDLATLADDVMKALQD